MATQNYEINNLLGTFIEEAGGGLDRDEQSNHLPEWAFPAQLQIVVEAYAQHAFEEILQIMLDDNIDAAVSVTVLFN